MMAWEKKFRVKDLLTEEDVEPVRVIEIAAEVARRLRKTRAFGSATGLLSRIFEMQVTDQEDFNAALDGLYDEADARRVWVE